MIQTIVKQDCSIHHSISTLSHNILFLQNKNKIANEELAEHFARVKEFEQILQSLKRLLAPENMQYRLASADISFESEKCRQHSPSLNQVSGKYGRTESDFDKNGNLMELKSHLHRAILLLDKRMVDLRPNCTDTAADHGSTETCNSKSQMKEATNYTTLFEVKLAINDII